jgi:hypothetical protein
VADALRVQKNGPGRRILLEGVEPSIYDLGAMISPDSTCNESCE